MATAAPHGVAPVAGAASLSPPQRRTAATDKAAFRLPPPAFPVNASTLSTSASANAAASLAAEFREWLSVAYLGSLLVNGADEDVARRIGTAMAVLSARPAPAAIHVGLVVTRSLLVRRESDESRGSVGCKKFEHSLGGGVGRFVVSSYWPHSPTLFVYIQNTKKSGGCKNGPLQRTSGVLLILRHPRLNMT